MFLGVSKIVWILILFTGIVFILFPEIDLYISGLFYTSEEGFYLAQTPWAQFFYDFGPQIVVVLSIIALILLIISRIMKRFIFGVESLIWLYLVLVMIVGPGLIVNSALKENWGRSRPYQVTQLGGTQLFSPALIINSHNATERYPGNSFVSGHAATGFSLIAIAFVIGRYRRVVFTGGVLYGGVIGFVRIVQGGHFLSDVIFAFIVIYLVAKILHYVMFDYAPTAEKFEKWELS